MNQLIAHSDMDRAVPYGSTHSIGEHPLLALGARMTLWAAVCIWTLMDAHLPNRGTGIPPATSPCRCPRVGRHNRRTTTRVSRWSTRDIRRASPWASCASRAGAPHLPEKELSELQGQLGQQCPNAHIKQRGSASIARTHPDGAALRSSY